MPARALLLTLALLALPGAAQETVFYKCTDSAGQVSMQNGTPCPAGSKQEIRRIGEVRSAPLPRREAAPPPPPPQPAYGEFVLVSGPNMRKSQPAAENATLPMPVPLYQCTTWDGDTYLGEDEQPPSRCAPLQVVGLDGSAASAGGSACEMKADQCDAVPEAQLCTAWLRRLDEAQFRATHAPANLLGERQRELQRLQALLRDTRCAPAAEPAATP